MFVAIVLTAGGVVTSGINAMPGPGRAAGWGDNFRGQLGDGSTTNASVPMGTSGDLAGRVLTSISAGQTHTCAVSAGRAYCWGDNSSAQLGTGNTTNSSLPIAVNIAGVLADKTVTAISAGDFHTCAIADGRVFCWGMNGDGQLGNGRSSDSALPVAVDVAGRTVTAISAGRWHTCAIADGRVYCWGANSSGQLGNNSTSGSNLPVPVYAAGVLSGKSATLIAAGDSHTCAVAASAAYCWGWNGVGQLGNNSTTMSSVPVAVVSPLASKTVTSISNEYSSTCAVAEGAAYCWGYNNYGQLGNRSTTDSKVPVAVDPTGVLAGKTVSEVGSGDVHACAVADGRAYCWGDNTAGTLGRSGPGSTSPVPVDTAGVLAGRTVTAIDAGGSHTAVLAASAPQPPSGVFGQPGDAQASLWWNSSGDDGGSPVIDYAATASPGGAACSTTRTSCAITGLANGSTYTFTVTARNAVGSSAPSAVSGPVTLPASARPPADPVVPVVAPGRVPGLKATVRRAKVKITWKPAAGASSYRVRFAKPAREWQATGKRVFRAKVLTGKKYRFQVAAVGAGGVGPVATVRFKGR